MRSVLARDRNPVRARANGRVDVSGAFQVATIGLAVVNIAALVVGFVAKSLHHVVDIPLHGRLDSGGTNWLTEVLETVTKMGNIPQTFVAAIIGAVVLAVWFARRGWRWWVPLLVMPVAWIGARGFQLMQTRLIDRDRGVLALTGDEIGGYPSGGVARTVLIGGLVVFLVVHYANVSTRVSRALFCCIAVLGLVEAFARWRLNQHWFTDVVGGACFGTMLLLVSIATIRAFDPDPPTHRTV